MTLPRRSRTLALAVLALTASAATAGAADVRAAAVPDVDLPACDAVLGRVAARFAHGAAHVEKAALTVAEFGKVRQQGAGVDDPSPIARRWCYAPVTLSDGSRSTAYWRIERAAGFAAPGLAWIPDGVEVCVLGHDRWFAHDGSCRATRLWW